MDEKLFEWVKVSLLLLHQIREAHAIVRYFILHCLPS